ncbi:MAG: hypothetical protein R3B70_01290 [Polyangiaceae bacterium]
MTFRSFVRPLFVALTLAFATTAAVPAFADNAGDKAAEHGKGKEKGKDKGEKGKDKGERGKARGHKGKAKGKDRIMESFPLPADKFTKVVETRLTHAKERISTRLSKSSLSEAEQAKILKDFDTGAEAIRTAAKAAGKDGTVTKDEAKSVRELVKNLRKTVSAKLPKKADKADKADKAVPKDV